MFKSILNFRRINLNVFIILLSLLFIVFVRPQNIFVLVFFIFSSNLYDVIGYNFLAKDKSEIELKAYRIIQFMFDYYFLAFVLIIFGWHIALGCFILKWFAVQDVLYYKVLQIEFDESWWWLKWSPLGFIFTFTSRKGVLKQSEVLIQAAVGVIISLVIACT